MKKIVKKISLKRQVWFLLKCHGDENYQNRRLKYKFKFKFKTQNEGTKITT
jgi:hypothetical protein